MKSGVEKKLFWSRYDPEGHTPLVGRKLRELVQAKDGGYHHFAEWFARGMNLMAQETGDPASDILESEAKSTTIAIVKCKPVTAGPTRALAKHPMRMAQETGELVQAKDGGDHHFAEWFARGMIGTAQEMGDPASGTLDFEAKSTITVIVKYKPVTAGPTKALAEQPVRMAQETGDPASGTLESDANQVGDHRDREVQAGDCGTYEGPSGTADAYGPGDGRAGAGEGRW